jgi:hypothetical protein
MEDLQKLVASPLVTGEALSRGLDYHDCTTENEFPSTFLKALSASGVETK